MTSFAERFLLESYSNWLTGCFVVIGVFCLSQVKTNAIQLTCDESELLLLSSSIWSFIYVGGINDMGI